MTIVNFTKNKDFNNCSGEIKKVKIYKMAFESLVRCIILIYKK